jgi:dihydrofolate synthase/folylpolyglutamate synthase
MRPLAKRVITVAGTNGKGSTCATLEAIGLAHGLRVGSYTSPHILRFNERIRLHGTDADDASLCAAFEKVEACRDSIALTYFEFTTLVAFCLFAREPLDLVILEVGLGGRLDAVNCVDPDVAVVTAIGLDHQSWLGNDRETIGREKAGIFRPGIPVVIGERNPPSSVTGVAESLRCRVYCYERDFAAQALDNVARLWNWRGRRRQCEDVTYSNLHLNRFPVANQASAIQAFELTGFQVHGPQIQSALASVMLCGRLQKVSSNPDVYLDVGHNPHAASYLAETIAQDRADTSRIWLGVFSALADKDIRGIVETLAPFLDEWHYWPMDAMRAAPVAQLNDALAAVRATQHDSFAGAFAQACLSARRDGQAGKNSAILVFGSFHVVQAALQSRLHHDSTEQVNSD